MNPDASPPPSSPHLASFRSKANAALMRRRKAEARSALGNLASISGDPDDRRNLEALVEGVSAELAQHIKRKGSIYDRLQDGVPLEEIQIAINQDIPHWRAFAGDLPELALARDGLSAHEDPATRTRVRELEKLLGSGKVEHVLTEWEELGEPESAASGAFVQVVRLCESLNATLAEKNWGSSANLRKETAALLETEGYEEFRSGCATFLKSAKEQIDREDLLSRCREIEAISNKERRTLLEELIHTEERIQLRVRDNPSLKVVSKRLNAAIERLEERADNAEPSEKGTVSRGLVMFLVLAFLTVLAIWFYFRMIQGTQLN